MARGPGAHIAPVTRDADGQPAPGTAFKVRWRERVAGGGWRHRSRTFRASGPKTRTPPREATEFLAELLRTLDAGELPELPKPAVRREVGTFDEGCVAFLEHKRRRLAPASRVKYGRAITRWFRSARKVLGLADDAPIPLDKLDRELFGKVLDDWRPPPSDDGVRPKGLSESTVYNSARIVLEAWEFCADDPDKHPGCPPPPRVKSRVLPEAPIYVAPPAPRLDEVDACIRRIPSYAYVAMGVAIVARYTGLRVTQIVGIRREDVDLDALTITVRLGKSRREKAEQRKVPILRAMLEDLRRAGVLEHDGEWLLRRRRDLRAPPNRNHHPSATIRDAWEAATEAKETRREVWDPPTRLQGRPIHAFRAALQAHLQSNGVAAEVIDMIVGHAGTSTRARHYASPDELLPVARAALEEHMSPIDWHGPHVGDGADVIPLRKRHATND